MWPAAECGQEKLIVVDVRKKKTPPSLVCISVSDMEIVRSCKYLDVHLDDKLEWSTNTEAAMMI